MKKRPGLDQLDEDQPTGMVTALSPVLTPHGRLLLAHTEDAPTLPADLSSRLEASFRRGHGHGLLQLGAAEVGTVLPAVFGYWREFGTRYVTAVCTLPDIEEGRARASIRSPSCFSVRFPQTPSGAFSLSGQHIFLHDAGTNGDWIIQDQDFVVIGTLVEAQN